MTAAPSPSEELGAPIGRRALTRSSRAIVPAGIVQPSGFSVFILGVGGCY